MTEEKLYLITEEQLSKLVLNFGAFLAGSDIATEVRSHPYNPQAEREKVLDELGTKIMQAVGIANHQHYDLENSEIPVLGIDELAEIIGNLRQSTLAEIPGEA